MIKVDVNCTMIVYTDFYVYLNAQITGKLIAFLVQCGELLGRIENVFIY